MDHKQRDVGGLHQVQEDVVPERITVIPCGFCGRSDTPCAIKIIHDVTDD